MTKCRYVLGIVVIAGVALALAGCGLWDDPERPRRRFPQAVLEVSVHEGTLTVVADASASLGRNLQFAWDFDDGEGFVDGGETASHTYDEPGVYNITVKVTEQRGRVGRSDTASFVVRLPEPLGGPRAVIQTFRRATAMDTDAFISWEHVAFIGTGSWDPLDSPLSYWWEIWPLDREGNRVRELPFMYWKTIPIVNHDAAFTIRIPGLTQCARGERYFRRIEVRLTVWNNRNQHHTAVKFITVTGG